MRQYILKRLLLMIPTLFGVAVLIFFLLRVVPGDIVELKYAGTGSYAPKEALARERAQLGLDQPIWKQFISWIVGYPPPGLRHIHVDGTADYPRDRYST